jgi:hypothetical protein
VFDDDNVWPLPLPAQDGGNLLTSYMGEEDPLPVSGWTVDDPWSAPVVDPVPVSPLLFAQWAYDQPEWLRQLHVDEIYDWLRMQPAPVEYPVRSYLDFQMEIGAIPTSPGLPVTVGTFIIQDVVQVGVEDSMLVPPLMYYTQLNEKVLTFGPVTDTLSGNPIVGATVLVYLYADRSYGNPGTLVPQMNGIVLFDRGEGIYQGTMDDPTFDPAPGSNYVTVITLNGGGGQGHWEILSVVLPRAGGPTD